MKITSSDIYYLVKKVLTEGYQDDLEQLQGKFPEQKNVLSTPPFTGSKGPKWIAWLSARFLTGARSEPLPMEHVAYTVKDFAAAEHRLVALWNQPAFKTAVDQQIPPARRSWTSPTDITNMSAEDMDTLLQLAAQADAKKRDRLGIDYDTVDVSGDKLGQIGPWTLWMPTTRENSCTIVRVRDPATGQMGPSPCTWCTTRTDASNLFYSYVARNNENIVLFYIIKEDPKESNDFISIGFLNGVMITEGQYGGITVNCKNEGLEEKDLKDIFGNYYENIIKILSKKINKLSGEHPAKSKLFAAAQSLESLDYLLKGIGINEKADLVMQILNLDRKKTTPEVEKKCFEIAAKSSDESVLRQLLGMERCPNDILKKLIDNPEIQKNEYILGLIIYHKNCTTDILLKIINSKSSFPLEIYEETLLKLLKNPMCPEKMLEQYALENTTKYATRTSIAAAQNPKLSPTILDKLSQSENLTMRATVATNPNTPIPTLYDMLKREYSFSNSFYIKDEILKNPKCPDKLIEKIMNYDDESKTYGADYEREIAAANNPNTPTRVLLAIISKNVYGLKNLKYDFIELSFAIATNPNIPEKIKDEIFTNLFYSTNDIAREKIARSTKTPLKFLKKLSNVNNEIIANLAKSTLESLELQQESLKIRIKKLLKAVN